MGLENWVLKGMGSCEAPGGDAAKIGAQEEQKHRACRRRKLGATPAFANQRIQTLVGSLKSGVQAGGRRR